jgi:hypothetical protein
MTTAEMMGAPSEEQKPLPAAPAEAAGWLLRSSALAAVASGIAAVIVLPGLRGNASESVVVWADRVTATLAYFLLGLLISLLIWGGIDLGRVRGNIGAATRAVLMGTGSAVLVGTLIVPFAQAYREPLPPLLGLVLVTAASVSAIVAAYGAVLRPHTRAPAVLLMALAFAAVARLGAWEVAERANDHADLGLFHWSRALATAGVVFEALGQLIAVTWLGTRSRLAGQVGSTVALLVALALTWGVAAGVHSGAAPWQYVLHTALADAPGLPPPFALDAVATFLVPASLLLALVSAAQPHQAAAVVACVALALVSHGAFDAPLRAMCVIVASVWITLASADDGLQGQPWQPLLGESRLANEGPAS